MLNATEAAVYNSFENLFGLQTLVFLPLSLPSNIDSLYSTYMQLIRGSKGKGVEPRDWPIGKQKQKILLKPGKEGRIRRN